MGKAIYGKNVFTGKWSIPQEQPEIIIPPSRDKNLPFTPKSDIFTPQTFNEYVGQQSAKDLARIMVKAAYNEHRPLPNIMVVGEYGQGKTSLAQIIMREAGLRIVMHDGSSLNAELPDKGTFIIDEIHNLDSNVADTINMYLDSGAYHIIGCTNNPGKLPSAFRSRFRTLQLSYYTTNDLKTIIRNVCKRKFIATNPAAIELLAMRSRFNARQATMYLSMVFDIMSVNGEKTVTKEVVNETFDRLGVDAKGLLPRDREYLDILPEGRAVGLQYLAARLGIDEDTIQQEVEPYLMRLGYVDRTARGRIKIEG